MTVIEAKKKKPNRNGYRSYFNQFDYTFIPVREELGDPFLTRVASGVVRGLTCDRAPSGSSKGLRTGSTHPWSQKVTCVAKRTQV